MRIEKLRTELLAWAFCTPAGNATTLVVGTTLPVLTWPLTLTVVAGSAALDAVTARRSRT